MKVPISLLAPPQDVCQFHDGGAFAVVIRHEIVAVRHPSRY